MGFLDHLWDETLAGPNPDSGIGKRRAFKYLRITVLRSNSITSSPATLSTPSSPLTPTTPGTPFSRKHS